MVAQLPSQDDLLDGFLQHHVHPHNLVLYPAQEEAILELLDGSHVILATPTGSGKSLVAQALHYFCVQQQRRSIYTCPIKALVSEKFFALCQSFGPQQVGLMTGDATINRQAPILCCTAEILANMALMGQEQGIDDVIMDEFHYYGDKDRGTAWQLPLLALPKTRFLLMSATLGDTQAIAQQLQQSTGRKVHTIGGMERPVPLSFLYKETPLHETINELLAQQQAPVYVVYFTQQQAVSGASDATSLQICSKEEKQRIQTVLANHRFDTPFGKDMRRFLQHGIGLHHAGLLPKYRLLVEQMAQQGLLKLMMGTDTLGVGVNIPIRTVLLTQLCKFNGEKTALLSVREFQQIAGRAGRRGFDTQGTVVAQAPEHIIENKRLLGKASNKANKKKPVLKKAPTKHYVPYDEHTFLALQSQPPEPLQSVFALEHGHLLMALQHHQGAKGYRFLVQLIASSHHTERGKTIQRRHLAQLFKSLRTAGVIHLRKGPHQMALHVDEDLQQNFRLMQDLSLFLLHVLPLLDADSPTYGKDVLHVVEACADTPHVILQRQVDRRKTQAMAEMKAEGLPYEDRIAKLEEITWEKPLADFLYLHYNSYQEAHPWLAQISIQPKSIVEEMYSSFSSFSQYIRLYGLERVEGLLFRYLCQIYRMLQQSVPQGLQDDALLDIRVYLRQMIAAIDTSLLDAWQALGESPRSVERDVESPVAPNPAPVAASPKELQAQVRMKIHRFVAALAQQDYAEAQELLQPASQSPWSSRRLTQAFTPFWQRYPQWRFTPHSRLPHWTQFEDDGEQGWFIHHTLADPDGDNAWSLQFYVEQAACRQQEGPLLQLEKIVGDEQEHLAHGQQQVP